MRCLVLFVWLVLAAAAAPLSPELKTALAQFQSDYAGAKDLPARKRAVSTFSSTLLRYSDRGKLSRNEMVPLLLSTLVPKFDARPAEAFQLYSQVPNGFTRFNLVAVEARVRPATRRQLQLDCGRDQKAQVTQSSPQPPGSRFRAEMAAAADFSGRKATLDKFAYALSGPYAEDFFNVLVPVLEAHPDEAFRLILDLDGSVTERLAPRLPEPLRRRMSADAQAYIDAFNARRTPPGPGNAPSAAPAPAAPTQSIPNGAVFRDNEHDSEITVLAWVGGEGYQVLIRSHHLYNDDWQAQVRPNYTFFREVRYAPTLRTYQPVPNPTPLCGECNGYGSLGIENGRAIQLYNPYGPDQNLILNYHITYKDCPACFGSGRQRK